MEATQVLLTITLIVAMIFLVVVGAQVYITLSEFRKSLSKFNDMIEDIERAENNIEHGFREFLGFFGGFRTLLTFVEKISEKVTEIRNN